MRNSQVRLLVLYCKCNILPKETIIVSISGIHSYFTSSPENIRVNLIEFEGSQIKEEEKSPTFLFYFSLFELLSRVYFAISTSTYLHQMQYFSG